MKLSVFLFFPAMPCLDCKRVGKDETHSFCRRHSFCSYSEGAQYFAAPCFTCTELWERVSQPSDPEDARIAWRGLSEWISGFRRNSRNRQKGQDFFKSPEERVRYERLHAIMSVGEPSSSLTSSSSQAAASAVSIFDSS